MPAKTKDNHLLAWPVPGWFALGVCLFALAALLAFASPLFGYTYNVVDMPVFHLAGGMVLAGILFLSLAWLIPASARLDTGTTRVLLWGMLTAGLAMRLVMFAGEPALEDDYQRYLWDGAVTAHGLNPYEISPDAAKAADPAYSPLGRLANESGSVLGRVNHPQLRTVYPPVAQGVFALSHIIGPWSLTTWRLCLLLCDLATVALVLLLLREVGRSPLWASLYWWNPIAVKELFNAAHMEAILLPLVLAGLLFAVRRRALPATVTLTLAAGVKLWPLLLLPLAWRSLSGQPRQLVLNAALAAAGCALMAWPVISAGLDPASGFVAYATKWKTNSALFPLLQEAFGPVPARALVAAALGLVTLVQLRTQPANADDLLSRAFIIIATLFLLSPAQFPWYYLWVLPLLCLFPVPGLLILTATLPLYYTAFHFLSHDTYETFSQGIVWLIWLPCWGILLWQARDGFARRLAPVIRSPA